MHNKAIADSYAKDKSESGFSFCASSSAEKQREPWGLRRRCFPPPADCLFFVFGILFLFLPDFWHFYLSPVFTFLQPAASSSFPPAVSWLTSNHRGVPTCHSLSFHIQLLEYPIPSSTATAARRAPTPLVHHIGEIHKAKEHFSNIFVLSVFSRLLVVLGNHFQRAFIMSFQLSKN